jgi:hypothetical protein
MALSAARATPKRAGTNISLPMAAATVVFGGGLVSVLTANGNACPAGTASSTRALGVAKATVDNSDGAGGALRVELDTGVFRFKNSSAGDLIARADIGQPCYIVDDETVAKTDNGGAREIAGAIVDVDDQGVWVNVGPSAVGPQGEQGEPGA